MNSTMCLCVCVCVCVVCVCVCVWVCVCVCVCVHMHVMYDGLCWKNYLIILIDFFISIKDPTQIKHKLIHKLENEKL